MSPTFHALQVLAMPAAAIACAIIWRPKKLTVLQIGLTVSGALIILLIGSGFSHACNAGNPVTQPVIGALSSLIAGLLIGNWKVRAVLCIGLGFMTARLSNEYADMVHKEGITGNPGRYERMLESRRRSSQERLAGHRGPDTRQQKGWLWTLDGCNFDQDDCIDTRAIVGRSWHTCFTRIYPYTRTQVALWYPGGAAQIEWRDYP